MLFSKIELLSDVGTSEDIEDGFVANPPFFAVFDGVSTPYSKSNPKKYYGENKLSSGTLVTQEARRSLQALINPQTTLSEALLKANSQIAALQKSIGRSLSDTANLAGATFAAAKIGEKTVEILQAGDSYAVLITKNGKVIITPNQLLGHDGWGDTLFRKIQMRHLKKNGGNLKEARISAWNEYYPLWLKQRTVDINNPKARSRFGLLNGQPQLQKCWFSLTVPSAELQLIILFTDGLIDYRDFKNEEELKAYLLEKYKKVGLKGLLSEKRRKEEKNKKRNYIDHTEATAIAITL